MTSSRNSILIAALLLFAAVASALTPNVESVKLVRSGDDLVIDWAMPAQPIDGFRVYRSYSLDCVPLDLILDTTGTSFTEPDAFAPGAQPALYRLTTYLCADEGFLSAPIYTFQATFTYTPGAANWNFISFPPKAAASNGQELCTQVNEQIMVSAPVSNMRIFNENDTLTDHHCAAPLLRPRFFDRRESYIVIASSTTTSHTSWIWGFDHPDEPQRILYRQPRLTGYRMVYLPYDHVYRDLMDVAAEIPTALEILIFDPTLDDPRVGLSRATASDPWSGPNLPLGPLRGQGLAIASEVSVNWTPRRQCVTPGLPTPGVVSALLMARDQADTKLWWTPEASSAQGYLVYRVEPKDLIPTVTAEAFHFTVPNILPTFPIVDLDAAIDPAPIVYYQVIGLGEGGDLGSP